MNSLIDVYRLTTVRVTEMFASYDVYNAGERS